MKKNFLILLLLLALLLTACGTAEAPVETTTPTVVPTEAPTDPPPVDIGGTLVNLDATQLNLAESAYDLEALLAAAPQLEGISWIGLGQTELTYEQVTMIRSAFPNAEISYTVEVLGHTMDTSTEYLDLSAIKPDQAHELMSRLQLLPNLQQVNFVSENGVCVFAIEDIPVLDELQAALPEVNFRVSFDLFGQTVTSEDERIEYYRVSIGNEGVEQVRAVLPYLKDCQYLLMDGCGVDNEVMAQLRDDFPQTKVVWRVWLAGPYYNSEAMMKRCSFLTDTHLIRTVVVTDKNCDVLKYCTETKYVDFGHNPHISTCEFLSYMPDLEVAILALTNMSDLSPLVNCPKLEYLELFEAKFHDLSPLAGCTNLEHLNIATLPNLSDISPLFGLTKLKRLRVIKCPKIPAEQLEEFMRLVPECEILDEGWDETGNGWRADAQKNRHPRYELLREQMRYDEG